MSVFPAFARRAPRASRAARMEKAQQRNVILLG